MPTRPASIPQSVWSTLTPYAQKVLDNTNQLSRSTRTAEQQRVWDMAKAKVGGAPSAPAGGGGGGGGGQDFLPGAGSGVAPAAESQGPFRSNWQYTAANDLMQDPARLSQLLQIAGYGGSLDDQLSAALLQQAFGGVGQWRANVTGQGVSESGPLANTRMAVDQHALNLLIGTIQDELEHGRNPAALMQQRAGMVPGWADQSLLGGGNILSRLLDTGKSGSSLLDLGLVKDPDVNLTDPSKPFFPVGAHPPSLLNLTGLQGSEESVLQGMSAPEFFQQVYPLYKAQFDRPAGSPAPFASGLTLGAPAYDPATGTYQRSPITQTPAYARYQAYGYPRPPDNGKEGTFGPDANAAGPMTGWQGWTEQFAPWNVDPTFIQRLMAMLGLPVGPNTMGEEASDSTGLVNTDFGPGEDEAGFYDY